MVKARPSDSRHRLAEPPSWVEITIVVDPDRPGLRQRMVTIGRRMRHGVVATLVLTAVVIALAALAAPGTRTTGPQHASKAAARVSGPRGVAAAYGYPMACLSITLSRENSAYARVDFNRAVACGRYGGSVTTIFHRVDGAWSPVVDAAAYPCPVAAMPRPVQIELGVCTGGR